jgi:hypothetical protein
MKTKHTPESQKDMILKSMLNGKKLTCLTSLKMFDCLNLRNRICEIIADRKYKVNKAWKRTKSGKNVRVYSIDI